MKHVALITINYNSQKETHDCLVSLKSLILHNVRLSIIVVDNGSKIPFSLSQDEEKQGVRLIRSEKNLGFTGGNNLGIKHALQTQVDFIMLLNNDTIVDPHLLKNLLDCFEKNEKIGVVVPKIYFAKGHEFHKDRYAANELGKVLWYAGGGVDWKNVFTYHRGVDKVDTGQYDTQEEVDFATGCCLLIKSKVLEKIGVFNDRYFLYFEDGDLSERIKRSGYKIEYCSKAFLWHINAGSSGSGSSLHDYYLTRNRMLFGMTYAPFRSKIALIRESVMLLFSGRVWQKKGIQDFYLGRFGKGSYN